MRNNGNLVCQNKVMENKSLGTDIIETASSYEVECATLTSQPKADKRLVYSAKDVAEMLGIGRTAAYDFIRKTAKTQEPFRVLTFAGNVRVPKESFDKWISGGI